MVAESRCLEHWTEQCSVQARQVLAVVSAQQCPETCITYLDTPPINATLIIKQNFFLVSDTFHAKIDKYSNLKRVTCVGVLGAAVLSVGV
jgi:hypothetical protein